MKRAFSLALCLCLAFGLAVSALGDMETELADVTAQVKEILEIDDDYADFSGNYSDGPFPGWSLYWSDDDRDLSVTCKADGTVTDVYYWENTGSAGRFYGFDPAFPALSREEAEEQAAYWLDRLLTGDESARVDSREISVSGDGAYTFTGRVLINGLESPVTFRLCLEDDGLASYYRSDSYGGYVGDIPDGRAAVTEEDAARSLAEAVELALYYVTDAASGQARLTYVPVGACTVVDAAGGGAVDMDGLYAAFGASASNSYADVPMAAEADAAAGDGGTRGLTETELASIANYGQVLAQEELDGALKDMTALGLEDFALQRCSYALDSRTGDVTASLRYAAAMTEDRLYGYSRSEYEQYIEWGETPTIYKYITVNAKTGALLSVSTSYPLWQKDSGAALDEQAYRQAAEDFLAQAEPALYGQTGLCALGELAQREGLTYARTRDGYFFPENCLYVEINPAEKTVDAYTRTWDEDVEFAPSGGVIGADEAKAAYIDALDVRLGYVAWPESVEDEPGYQTYMDWGYTWVESLRLAYYYSGRDSVSGVDALTGEALVSQTGDGVYAYEDLAGVPQREEIEALGQAGIGFPGGSFQPEKTLTQRDAVTLLLQAAGYDPSDWSEETLESQARNQGFLTGSGWSPDETVSRMEFLRMLLGPSRYGDSAGLTGLWAEAFDSLPEADRGYGAIAAALGMADGETLSRPDAPCTRAGAAVMLYAFMSR